ncbi:MAG: DUF4968 domain-containing protein [Anaerolineae bacterium]|nr:DUF4968 domain-containing protein [Anaerolineae bacterium]
MTTSNPLTMIQAIRNFGLQTALRAIQYNTSIRTLDRRFGQKKARGRFKSPGKVVAIHPYPRGVVIQAENSHIQIEFVTPEIVRVRMRVSADFSPPFSYAIESSDWSPVKFTSQETAEVVRIETPDLACQVHKASCRLTFRTEKGVISEDTTGLAYREQEVRWARKLPAGEVCLGLGQRASSMNLRGKQLKLWNADPMPGYARDADPVYMSIPFYVGLRPDLAYGVLWDNPARGYVDLGADRAEEMAFSAEDGELRFYLFAGETVQAVLKLYTTLTGRMPLLPMWALGFHQSRWSYESETEFRQIAEEFRRRKLPCDALYFDIDYMDEFRCFTWNRKQFPMMPRLLQDLERQGFKSVAIVDPGIKVDEEYKVYEHGARHDVFLKYPNDAPVIAPVWPGKCQFPDFTSARVRAWWGGQFEALTQAGFAGFWNDMNEPALLTFQHEPSLPDYVMHDWDGLGSTHVQGGHNVYGMLMSRATREGVEKQRPDKRPFIMTRAGYAGIQRYATTWTGDNDATWDHLRLSVSMVLNAGLSGVPFTGPDVGGFAGDPDGELFTRWMQLGSMLPYFRSHTAAGTARQEPWSFGDRYESIIRESLELRYQLLPYFYSIAAQCSQDGTPIVRPLFMADPTDDTLREIDDEFMVGDSILVAPVLEPGVTERQVYLPRGVWYEFDTGKLIDGAQYVTAQAPLERMPIYIRAGKVLPMWPVLQYVGERPLAEGRLRAYAGSGETTVYEDAGEGLAYQDGNYRWSYFTCKFLPSGQFAVEWRRAGQYLPSYDQVRVEIVGIPIEPESVTLDGQAAPIWYYEGGIVEFIVKPFNEARIIGRLPSQRTVVRPPGR